MPGNYSLVYTESAGNTILASRRNAEHQNHINKMEPQYMDDYSSDATEMRATEDPGENGTESLATSLQGELTRLRFAILETKQAIDAGLTYWYETPSASLVTGPGSSTDNAVARYNGTGGAIQDSSVLIDDSDNVTGVADITQSGELTQTGSNLASNSAPTADTMYPNSQCKAWAILTLGAAGAVTVTNGFNIDTASYSSNTITVNFHTNMANANYVAMIQPVLIQDSNGDFPVIDTPAVSTFDVILYDGTDQSLARPWTSGDVVHILVFGEQ